MQGDHWGLYPAAGAGSPYQVDTQSKDPLDFYLGSPNSPYMMLTISLITNVLVTFAVTFVIWRNAPRTEIVFGPDTPARRILACVYLTIGIVSLYALAQIGSSNTSAAHAIALTLLPLQIIYKLMTAIAGGLRHPVVLANLAIVVLHGATLISML